MAEFQEVMRQWKRRFEAEKTLVDSKVKGLDALWLAMDNPDEIESVVMSWAAEHPEPVYETWFEWLEQIGVTGRAYELEPYFSGDKEIYLRTAALTLKAFEPIPADFAQKLGIEPKEAT